MHTEHVAKGLVSDHHLCVFVLNQHPGLHAFDQCRQARTSRQQIFFVSLAVGNVLESGHTTHVEVAFEQRYRHDGNGEQAAILACKSIEIGTEQMPRNNAGVHRAFSVRHRQPRRRLKVNQVMNTLTQHFLTRPTEQTLGLGINKGTTAILIIGDHPLAQGVGQASHEAVAFLNHLLLLFESCRGVVERFNQLLNFDIAAIRG